MSAAPAPDAPTLPRTSEQTRSSRLLGILHKLIEFGRALAQVLSQNPDNTVDGRTAHEFGSSSISLILQRIKLGLMRAAALQAHVQEQAAKLDETPFWLPPLPSSTPCTAAPDGPRWTTPAAAPTDALLALMPSVEQIARDVRRRSVGAVLADICRDLGIGLGHPLWLEVHNVMLDDGASASTRLMREQVNRSIAWDDMQALKARQVAIPAPIAPPPPCAATGPP